MNVENEKDKNTPTPPQATDNSAEVAQEAAKKEGEGGQEGNQAPEKAPREIFIERVRASRPDGKYDDDEQEVYRQALSWIDEITSDSKKQKQVLDKMVQRFIDEPEVAPIWLDFLEDTPFDVAVSQNMDVEDLMRKEGDEGYEEYKSAVEKRKADRERLMERAKSINENSKTSDELFNKWANDNELDDEQKQAVWDLINGDLEALMEGRLSEDLLNRYRAAKTHDADVEAAHEQGKVEGRGEAIDAKHKRMQGSGLPSAGAGGDVASEVKEDDPREMLAKKFAGFRRG